MKTLSSVASNAIGALIAVAIVFLVGAVVLSSSTPKAAPPAKESADIGADLKANSDTIEPTMRLQQWKEWNEARIVELSARVEALEKAAVLAKLPE